MIHRHLLHGCSTTPLASYLAALGVMRLVAQEDPGVRGCWVGQRFQLSTRFDRNELLEFFVSRYRPTPIIAPWNGGSGFYPKDNRTATETIESSITERFLPYRETIRAAKQVLTRLGLETKVGSDEKATLLEACRAELPDGAVEWLDAAYVLSESGPKYPPLLGTGGNDGRLEFTNNLMQRLIELIDPATGDPSSSSRSLIANALFDEPTDAVQRAPVGQYLPVGAGGANAEAGFDASSRVNSWDFVLMLEGALLFAAASVRRLGSHSDALLSAPFTVRPIGAGYGSAAVADESGRAEMWMPLWGAPCGLSEVQCLFAEGRAVLGRRSAGTGVEFARAISSLGVDRGLSGFERYGFHVRNGLSYFATPLGRFNVARRARADRVQEIDVWLERMRRAASSDRTPASIRSGFRRVEEAIFQLCANGSRDDLLGLLVSLGSLEESLGRSRKWAQEARVDPIPRLSRDWIGEVGIDSSVEIRLAAALAWSGGDGVTFREETEPVRTARRSSWVGWADGDLEVTWKGGEAFSRMIATLERRLVRAERNGTRSLRTWSPVFAGPSDIASFVTGAMDERRFEALVRGLCLVEPPEFQGSIGPWESRRSPSPGALHGLLALCFAGRPVRGVAVPIVPEVLALAAGGNGVEASRRAARRLRASGLVPLIDAVPVRGATAARVAAALLFPMSSSDLEWTADRYLARSPEPQTTSQGDDR